MRQSHKKANSEYRRWTGAPRYHLVVKVRISTQGEAELTSVIISYTIYLLRMNPCGPSILTFTVSCLLHQSFGNPDPAKLDCTPLVKLPLASNPLFAGAPNCHGSYDGAGGRLFCPAPWYPCGTKAEVAGCNLERSRDGSGRVFCSDKAATCSMLTSKTQHEQAEVGQISSIYLCQPAQVPQGPMQQKTQAWIPVNAS